MFALGFPRLKAVAGGEHARARVLIQPQNERTWRLTPLQTAKVVAVDPYHGRLAQC